MKEFLPWQMTMSAGRMKTWSGQRNFAKSQRSWRKQGMNDEAKSAYHACGGTKMTECERHFADVYAEVCADLAMEPDLDSMEHQLKRFRDDLERVLGVQND